MTDDDDKTRLIGRRPPPLGPHFEDADEPTRIIRRPDADGFVDPDGPTTEATRIYSADDYGADDATVLMNNSAGSGAGPMEESFEDQKTVLYRPQSKSPDAVSGEGASSAADDYTIEAKEPVVGWLVIVEGAGRGYSHPLSYGITTIGRDHTQRLSLDYGDQTISRENHVSMVYDPRGRTFYIQQGTGAALGYLDSAPILQPTKLEGGERIILGDTTLVFTPFCGADFDWQSESK